MCVVVLAACGGDDNGKMIDAAGSGSGQHDAAAATVQMVTCPATPMFTVMTSGFMYSPTSTTIAQGQVVQFVMPAEHDAEPGHFATDSAIADPGLSVGFGATKCLMFTQAGTYGFHCGPHHFDGTIIVQ